MYDKPIIVASPSHLTVRMLVARMRAGRRIESTKAMERKRAALIAGLEAWCEKNKVILDWSETPGRRSKNREYRIAYNGDSAASADPDALFSALDEEILRLMLL